MAVVTYEAPSASRSCMTVESDMGSRAGVLETTEDDDALHTVVIEEEEYDDDRNRRMDK